MEKNLTLLVMAAGMGSRFGGLKQLAPVGLDNETSAEYAIYDALRAGFSHIVFVIKEEMQADFEERVLSRLPKHLWISICYQKLDDLPEGFSLPEGRTKPWGTAHAVWSARHVIDGPFAAVNADDFYGAGAFAQLADHLRKEGAQSDCYCMGGYRLSNTVTEYGSVSRGICQVDADGMLQSVVEHVTIECTDTGIVSTLADGSRVPLAPDTLVSLNCWGFTPHLFPAIERALLEMSKQPLEKLLKMECFLPFVADEQRINGEARIRVYPTHDKWYGVTYREDLAGVQQAISQKIEAGEYPPSLWKEAGTHA